MLADDMPGYRDRLSTAMAGDMDKFRATIQKNYAMAEVFFQTLNVISIKEMPLLDVRPTFFTPIGLHHQPEAIFLVVCNPSMNEL